MTARHAKPVANTALDVMLDFVLKLVVLSPIVAIALVWWVR